MANIIKPKRSTVAAKVPTTAQMASGEIAVNSTDQKIYTYDGTNVLLIGAGKISGHADVTLTSLTSGQTLQWNGTAWVNTNAGSGIVTGVTATAPVVSSGGTAPVISMAAATASVNGYMTSTYAAKLDGIASGATANTGTVTSVGLALPSMFSVTGSPVTGSGTLTASLASQTANTVFAAPNGAAGAPTFRALVAADIPTLNQNTTGTAANVTGTVGVGNGGTGSTSFTAGYILYGNGTGALNSSANLVFDGNNLGIGGSPTAGTKLFVVNDRSVNTYQQQWVSYNGATNENSFVLGHNGATFLGNFSAKDFYIITNNAERVRFFTSGGVSIGNTTDPGAGNLSVTGNISATGSINSVKQATALAATSGTTKDFTSIPSWIKRITVVISGVSTSGSSDLQVRLGTSGGFQASGYAGGLTSGNNATVTSAMSTGFTVATSMAATGILHAKVDLVNVSGNNWVMSGISQRSDTTTYGFAAGSVTLSAVLNSIRVTAANGTDTFDLGSINILYE